MARLIRLLAFASLILLGMLPAAIPTGAEPAAPEPDPQVHAPDGDRLPIVPTIEATPTEAEADTTTVAEPTAEPAAAAPTPVPVVNASPHAAEPGCDGKPCGEGMDGPNDGVACPTSDYPGGTYTAGKRQLGGECPRDETPEEAAFHCPPDDWRAGDVRVDYAAEADGCGPLVGTWL